jgi:AcrR family transcriptional regulator
MRRGQHHSSLAQTLIDAAIVILDAVGIEGVTIRATARAASVSHAAPANHFPDRRALLTAIAVRCFEEMIAGANLAREKATTPAERIVALADAYVAYGLAYPNRYRMMWRMDMLDDSVTALSSIINGMYDSVGDDVAALPSVQGDTATTKLVALASLIHGYVSMRIDGNFIAAADEATGKPRHIAMIEALIGATNHGSAEAHHLGNR